ncbi:MAG: zinc ABC transporter substrate-binding protein [Treponema sp.]|nr:zinc ABC transporter substrate-binding protein [Treponema sp.]
MKRTLFRLTVILFAIVLLNGCFKTKRNPLSEKLNIVCTIYPEYDWVQGIVGKDYTDVTNTLIIKGGTDLHSFQPSVNDIIQISTCDLFIYIGGESDAWVEDAIAEAKNPDMKVICLMDVLKGSLREETLVEGMQDEEEEEDGHTEEIHHHDEDEIEYDEHIWLSVKNAIKCVKAIADAVVELDPKNQEKYRNNEEGYLSELQLIDREYERAVQAAPQKTIIVCDRFPFLYLTEDYGINYYAAFKGCSAETEASFETVVFLANKVNELDIKNVIVLDGSNQKLAKTVIQNSKKNKCGIIVLDSMQSTTLDQAFKGKTYTETMTKNLTELKKALCLN